MYSDAGGWIVGLDAIQRQINLHAFISGRAQNRAAAFLSASSSTDLPCNNQTQSCQIIPHHTCSDCTI